MVNERISKIAATYKTIENGNNGNGINDVIPGLRNCNKIEGTYISHILKRKNLYVITFSNTSGIPIDFNISSGVKFRLYQNSSLSKEDIIGKILKVNSKTNPFKIEVKVEKGNLNLSEVGDKIIFNLELFIETENLFKTAYELFPTNITNSSVLLKWTNPESKEIVGYALQYRKLYDSSNVNWTRLEFNNENEAVINGLETRTKYEGKVMIFYRNGNSNFSESVFFKTI